MAVVASTALAQYSAPRIFYSDLQSGPNTGGLNNRGTIVTIYGKGFGASRGTSTVTVGGGAAAAYLTWTDTKIAFQLGSAAQTGNIVATVAGVASTAVPFTVRSGNIYFVSTSGNDANAGTYSSPWATLTNARSKMVAGDIVYAMTGVAQTGLDSSSASLALSKAGTSGAPMAIVAYPGAQVTIGSASGQPVGVKGTAGQWVLAGLTLRGLTTAISFTSTNWRLVGNDISCPNGTGAAACVQGSTVNGVKLLGNYVHDSGSTSSTDVQGYDSVAILGASLNIEVGWNEIAKTRACRALRFYSTSTKQYSIAVHDNFIHEAICSGISLASVDPSAGSVRAYNNILFYLGVGPAPGGTEADSYACVNVAGGSSTAAKITNNTMYNCGARADGNSGGLSANGAVLFADNIVWVFSYQHYVSTNSNTSVITGNNNLFNGSGAAPTYLTSSIVGDPKFVSNTGSDFHLQSTSPAIDHGAPTATTTDYEGVPRPQGSAFDIGAYEYGGTSAPAGTGQLVSSPASLSFGSVNVGASSTQSVTLSNTGTGSATLSQVSITNPAFTVSGLVAPLTLTAGQSVSYTVTFTPSAGGAVSGTESLVSNATNSPSTLTLSGTGVAPTTASHSVKLAWNASSTSGVTGYYIYRGTQSGGPYTRLNATAQSALSYTDSTVAAGQTYYYAITAVAAGGTESGFSNQSIAVVPTP